MIILHQKYINHSFSNILNKFWLFLHILTRIIYINFQISEKWKKNKCFSLWNTKWLLFYFIFFKRKKFWYNFLKAFHVYYLKSIILVNTMLQIMPLKAHFFSAFFNENVGEVRLNNFFAFIIMGKMSIKMF